MGESLVMGAQASSKEDSIGEQLLIVLMDGLQMLVYQAITLATILLV